MFIPHKLMCLPNNSSIHSQDIRQKDVTVHLFEKDVSHSPMDHLHIWMDQLHIWMDQVHIWIEDVQETGMSLDGPWTVLSEESVSNTMHNQCIKLEWSHLLFIVAFSLFLPTPAKNWEIIIRVRGVHRCSYAWRRDEASKKWKTMMARTACRDFGARTTDNTNSVFMQDYHNYIMTIT